VWLKPIKDVMSIENTMQYKGVYHVLGGVISPMEGIGPNDLTINSLIDRLSNTEVNEVILALSATTEGDTTNFTSTKDKTISYCGYNPCPRGSIWQRTGIYRRNYLGRALT